MNPYDAFREGLRRSAEIEYEQQQRLTALQQQGKPTRTRKRGQTPIERRWEPDRSE